MRYLPEDWQARCVPLRPVASRRQGSPSLPGTFFAVFTASPSGSPTPLCTLPPNRGSIAELSSQPCPLCRLPGMPPRRSRLFLPLLSHHLPRLLSLPFHLQLPSRLLHLLPFRSWRPHPYPLFLCHPRRRAPRPPCRPRGPYIPGPGRRLRPATKAGSAGTSSRRGAILFPADCIRGAGRHPHTAFRPRFLP